MKKGIIAGTWDLLHPGHVIAIQTAQENCDSLIIALHSDPSIERLSKNKPIESIFERFIRLQPLLRDDDELVPYDTENDLVNLLVSYDINVRFLDEEYENKQITGRDLVDIVYLDRKHSWSSSNLRKRIIGKPHS